MCFENVFEKLLTIPKLVTARAHGKLGEKPTSGDEYPFTRISVNPLVHSSRFTPRIPSSSDVFFPVSEARASLRFRTTPTRDSHTSVGLSTFE